MDPSIVKVKNYLLRVFAISYFKVFIIVIKKKYCIEI